MGATTSAILIILGAVLIVKPTFMHFHEDIEHGHSHHGHEHHEPRDDHENDDDDHHDHQHHSEHAPAPPKFKHGVYWGMFSIGFINMIVPCPTLAVMYSYALVAKSFLHGIFIFLVYAIATAIVLMFMAFLLVKASLLMKKFGQEHNEILISRISGVLIAGFGIYMVLIQFPAFQHIKLKWIL
jgi:nickel/cobalt exporter